MMAFLVANAGILSVVGVGLALFLLGFLLAPYISKNGKQKVIQGTDDVLQTLQMLVGHLNLGSMQGTAQTILNVAETAVHYVEQTMNEADNETKKETAIQTATTILGKVGVEVTDQEKQLLDVGIESAVSKMNASSTVVNPVVNVTSNTSESPSDVAKKITEMLKQVAPPVAPIVIPQMPIVPTVISADGVLGSTDISSAMLNLDKAQG